MLAHLINLVDWGYSSLGKGVTNWLSCLFVVV